MKTLLVLYLLLASVFETFAFDCGIGCEQCDPNSNDCVACSEGYELTILGSCVPETIQNCAIYGGPNLCLKCQPSFKIELTSCVKDYSGCVIYLTNTQCSSCSFGLLLSQGSCLGVLNCKIQSTLCQACDPGFALKNNVCYASQVSCLQVNPDNGVCLNCSVGYELVGYKCVSSLLAVKACYIYDTSGNCMICKDGYQIYSGECLTSGELSAILPNQNQSNSSQITKQNSSSTGIITILSQPQQNSAASQKLNSSLNSTNTSNLINQTLQGNSITKMAQSIFNYSDPNCLQYQTYAGARCRQCFLGYNVGSNGKCVKAINNCLKYNQTENGCIQCSMGYLLTEQSQCQVIQNISSFVNNVIGTVSSVDSSLLNSGTGSTIENVLSVKNPSSLYCQTILNNTCVQCYQGFYLNGSYCLQIDPLCKYFNLTNNLCQLCYSGYFLNSSNYKCQVITAAQIKVDPNCQKTDSSGNCLYCYSGFYINQNNGCSIANPICKSSNPNGTCLTCYAGYQLASGQCQIPVNGGEFDPYCVTLIDYVCSACTNGYFVSNDGSCQPLSLNCQTHNISDGSCLICLTGYSLSSGTCQQTINYCLQYSSNGKCLKCLAGYYVKQGICFANSVLCSSYSASGICLQCVATYMLFQGDCIFPSLGFDPLCVSYVNSYCTACKPGSFLSNFRCQAIDPNCLNFNPDQMRCLACVQGLKPYGITCQ